MKDSRRRFLTQVALQLQLQKKLAYNILMNKTRKRLKEYWDNLIAHAVPSYASFQKLETEFHEHFNWMAIVIKRLIVPLGLFFLAAGLIFGNHMFGSLVISLIVFIYSTFLPDIDILIKESGGESAPSLWYELYFFLFFAPLVVYYILAGKARPLFSTRARQFHSIQAVCVYAFFLFLVSSLFWPTEMLKRIMFPTFGTLGFVTHLVVDGTFRLFFQKHTSRIEK